MNVSIQTTEEGIQVKCPFNADFIKEAKEKYGSRWDGENWVFDKRLGACARKLCMKYFGADGVVNDTVNIRLRLTTKSSVKCGPITLLGRVVARATSKDSGTKMGEGVLLKSGGFKSTGTTKNWYTSVIGDTEVSISNFPKDSAMKLIALGAPISIDESGDLDDHYELKSERDRILKRLAEIDEKLKDVTFDI